MLNPTMFKLFVNYLPKRLVADIAFRYRFRLGELKHDSRYAPSINKIVEICKIRFQEEEDVYKLMALTDTIEQLLTNPSQSLLSYERKEWSKKVTTFK